MLLLLMSNCKNIISNLYRERKNSFRKKVEKKSKKGLEEHKGYIVQYFHMRT